MKDSEIKHVLTVLDTKLHRLIEKTAPAPLAPCSLFVWLERWVKTFKPSTLSESYKRALKSAINNVKAVLPDKPLSDYTAPEIMSALYKIQKSYTRQQGYYILNDCFYQAVRAGYILTNPLTGTETIRHTRNKGKALTLEEQRQFIQAIQDNPRKAFYMFCLLSGARGTEAVTLKWQDIDYTAQKIHIRGTKTPRADRFIPLFPQIGELLKDIPRNGEYVFPYAHKGIKSHFRRLKLKHGFNFRLHDLRHTFATRCIESGINLFTVSRWLGHTSINTTLSTYAHLLTDFERQEVAKFNPKI